MLVHLNHCFMEIQLGFTRLLYRLSSRLSGPSTSLQDTTLEHLTKKNDHPKVKYGQFTVPTTHIPSELIYMLFLGDAFNSAKLLWDLTTICRATSWHVCLMFLCINLWRPWKCWCWPLLSTWLWDKKTCYPDPRWSVHSDTTTLTTFKCWCWGLKAVFHFHSGAALKHWVSSFLWWIRSLGSIKGKKHNPLMALQHAFVTTHCSSLSYFALTF